MSGPASLTYSDIAAWAALTGRGPTPAEVLLLVDMDAAWRTEWFRCNDLKHPDRK